MGAMPTKAQPRASKPRVGKRDVADDLGPRLRRHREERQISLRELARRLGISPSAISQFETGKSRLSVSTLYAIVTELGISLDELFSGIDGDTPVTVTRKESATRRVPKAGAQRDATADGRHVQRVGSRRAIALETGVSWERLTPEADPEADFLYVVYEVGGSSCQGERFIRHSGREYGLVLSGTLEVTVGFDTYELGPGDSICFDSTVPHCLRTIGNKPVHGVWFVVGRQNDARGAALGSGVGDATPPRVA
jgi:quercetin dioxygenase-like cupin family protein/DNA-binding XRE family transcriptional regulator